MPYSTDGMTYMGAGEGPAAWLEWEIKRVSQGFKTVEVNGLPVVSTPHSLDLINARQLSEAILAAAPGSAGVVVDMTAVRFIDCAVLGALIRAYRHLAEYGLELRIATTNPRARWMMAVQDTELPLFRVFDTLSEALTAPSVPASLEDWDLHPQAA